MKSKTFPTLKAAALGLVVLGLSACNLPTSEEAVQAKIGQNLDQVIAEWGYPTGERQVSGRSLVYWDEIEVDYDNVPQIGVSVPIGNNGRISASIPLGEPVERVCRRVLEINRQETVTGASIEGGNCPYFAPNTW